MEPERYAWLCSKLTLQSDKRGFFQQFADSVEEIANDEWMAKLEKSSTDEQRLTYCYTSNEVGKMVQQTLEAVQPVFRGKSERMCEEAAEAADAALRRKDLIVAIRLANQAVARAPPTEIVSGSGLSYLVWALRIRCKVLEASSLWDLALTDLQLLLKQNPPSNIKDETYMKMATCYVKKQDGEKAKIAINVCRKMCPMNKEILAKCDDLFEELSFIQESNKRNVTTKPPEPKEVKLNGFMEGVEMIESQESGRSMVAKQPVGIGELVVCEQPYASVLLPDSNGTHCHHCFVRLTTFVPCTQCSGVAFCSITCHKEAMCYHRYECNFIQLMIGSGMSVICSLALRIITQQNVAYFTKAKGQIHDAKSDHPYAKVYNLESHTKMRDTRSFLHRSLMALLLLKILKKSGYFSSVEGPFTDEEIFIGGLLLRNLQVLQYNAHEIYESVYRSRTDMKRSKTNYIAIAVYPQAAMLNHDCQPTLARYFIGRHIALRCIKPIRTGEAVTENYGPVFTMKSKQERQKNLLARYLFVCKCKACTEDWPTLENMKDNDVFVRCQKKGCKGFKKYRRNEKDSKCPTCEEKISLEERYLLFRTYQLDFDKGIQLMEEGKTEEAVEVLLSFIKSVLEIVLPPNRLIALAQEALRNSWASQFNSYFTQ